jgi:hypothetical protein
VRQFFVDLWWLPIVCVGLVAVLIFVEHKWPDPPCRQWVVYPPHCAEFATDGGAP